MWHSHVFDITATTIAIISATLATTAALRFPMHNQHPACETVSVYNNPLISNHMIVFVVRMCETLDKRGGICKAQVLCAVVNKDC